MTIEKVSSKLDELNLEDVPRFAECQINRTLLHPLLPQPTKNHCLNNFLSGEDDAPLTKTSLDDVDNSGKDDVDVICGEHSFVICADTQLGMRDKNESWEYELEISRRVIKKINKLSPLPTFVTVCGDLIDMEQSFYKNSNVFSLDRCHEIQDKQNKDFQEVWSRLDKRIALVCICGNHDVGNTPTHESISRFTNAFGDDYLSFWCNRTYNVVINTNLLSDPSESQDLFDQQIIWLERSLKLAQDAKAENIFIFGHHPLFLYDENEVKEDLPGVIPYPSEWGPPPTDSSGFPDWYFHIKIEYRKIVLALLEKYNVDAAFCGHFHQNLCARTSFGMEHVVTAPLSMVFNSSAKVSLRPNEPDSLGFRVVKVKDGAYSHSFVPL